MVERVLLTLLVFAAGSARLAADSDLRDADIARLKTICDTLARGSDLDVALARSKGGVLRRFLQSRKAGEADPGIMISHCTDFECAATLPLLGDAEIEFKWPNVPKRPSDIPITSVRLLRHGRTLYVATRPSNHALEPTADRR